MIILVTIIVALSSILPDLFGCDAWVALRDATAMGAVFIGAGDKLTKDLGKYYGDKLNGTLASSGSFLQ